MTMHKARKGLKQPCPVCGVEPLVRCQQATPKVPGKKPFVLDTEPAKELAQDDLAWCEFAFFAACHNLKKIDPDHPMVKAVEAALTIPVDPAQLDLPLQ